MILMLSCISREGNRERERRKGNTLWKPDWIWQPLVFGKLYFLRITVHIMYLFASTDGGLLLSSSVMQNVALGLDWCVKNAFSDSDDDNVGRCIVHASEYLCTNSIQVHSDTNTRQNIGTYFKAVVAHFTACIRETLKWKLRCRLSRPKFLWFPGHLGKCRDSSLIGHSQLPCSDQTFILSFHLSTHR